MVVTVFGVRRYSTSQGASRCEVHYTGSRQDTPDMRGCRPAVLQGDGRFFDSFAQVPGQYDLEVEARFWLNRQTGERREYLILTGVQAVQK